MTGPTSEETEQARCTRQGARIEHAPDLAAEAFGGRTVAALPEAETAASAGTKHFPAIDTAAALAAWEDYAVSKGFQPASLAQYRSMGFRFFQWLEPLGVAVDQIRSSHVQDFLDAQDVVPTTRVHYRSILRRFFDALVSRGLMAANPLSRSAEII